MGRRWFVSVAVVVVLAAACSSDKQEGNEAGAGATEETAGPSGSLRSLFGPTVEGVADPLLHDADVGPDGSVYVLISEELPPEPGSTTEKHLTSLFVVPPKGGPPRLIAKEGQPGFEKFYGSEVVINDTTGEIYVYNGVLEQVTIVNPQGATRLLGVTGKGVEGIGPPRTGIPDVGSADAIALDSSTGDLYLATGIYIVRLDSQGALHVLLEDTFSRESREKGEGAPTPEIQDVEVVREGPIAAFEDFNALALNEKTGDLFFADGERIYRLRRDRKAHVLAGKGTRISIPDAENVYFAEDADSGSLHFLSDGRVFRIDPAGVLTVVAGSGESNSDATPDGPALKVALGSSGLAIGAEEKLYLTNGSPPQVQVLER